MKIIHKDDRRKAKQNFIKAIQENMINGKQLEIYNFARLIYNNTSITNDEINLFQAQWNKIKKNVINDLAQDKLGTTKNRNKN